jgi:hypothetical protein
MSQFVHSKKSLRRNFALLSNCLFFIVNGLIASFIGSVIWLLFARNCDVIFGHRMEEEKGVGGV